MKLHTHIWITALVISLLSITQISAQDQILKDSKSWVVPKTFENDPIGLKVFTLNNGLTVMLSEDHNQSKVFGAVVVKAGGKTDPKEATGMAHYLEHMLFKGTETM